MCVELGENSNREDEQKYTMGVSIQHIPARILNKYKKQKDTASTISVLLCFIGPIR
jgi:hypothetical protein